MGAADDWRNNVRLEDMNWMDVESYLQTDDRLILVTGACEQHGYLSLATDSKIPLALADAASEKTGVPVAPPVPFGFSPGFAAYPGTISLRLETLLLLVDDIVRDVYRQGFRRLLFLNGHGGNDPVCGILEQLTSQLPGLRPSWLSWWESPSVEKAMQHVGLQVFHAGAVEAFPFTRVAPLPEGVKPPVEIEGMVDPGELRRLAGDGVFGGPYLVSADTTQAVFQAAVDDVVVELERLRRQGAAG
jgi:creatinine amidohydrolase